MAQELGRGVSDTNSQAIMRRATAITDSLWRDACNEAQAHQDDEETPEVVASRCEKAVDSFCRSYGCSITNPFNRGTRLVVIRPYDLMITSVLQRARAKGWVIFGKTALPFVSDIMRDVWITAHLVTVLVAFILSVASVSLGNTQSFNVIHLVVIIFSVLLATIDAVLSFSQCRSCKEIRRYKIRNRVKPAADRNLEEAEGEDEDDEVSHTSATCTGGNKLCCECLDRCKSFSDFVRMILTELVLYILLICDMFELVIEGGHKGESVEDRIGFALFFISFIALVVYVYVLRLAALGYVILKVQRGRKLFQLDKVPSYDELWFQVFFFIHVFAQMLTQVCMLIAIGAKIQYDNHDGDGDVHVSGHLWYMIVSGYLLPIFGIPTFFVVTYYWTQEFPLGICLNFVSMLQMPNCGIKDAREKANGIADFFRFPELEALFNYLRKDIWYLEKLVYPFRSPTLVTFCVAYFALHFAFILCAVLTVNGSEREVAVLNNGGGWVVYIIFYAVVSVLANLYSFAVAAFWTTILVGILVVIALIILAIVLRVLSWLGDEGCK